MSSMNNYESFWVVVGTAAPVLMIPLAINAMQILRRPTRHWGPRVLKHVAYFGTIAAFLCCLAAMFAALAHLGDVGDGWKFSRSSVNSLLGAAMFGLLISTILSSVSSGRGGGDD